jgi:salicylate hydroxylase
MAIEDGLVLGMLLGSVTKRIADLEDPNNEVLKATIRDAFIVFEDLRKARTTRSVQGALRNREAFHMKDGILQWLRDWTLSWSGMTKETDWVGLMSNRQSQTLAHDVLIDCKRRISEA